MKSLYKALLAVALAAFFVVSALAQTGGTVANHAVPIGKGPGVTGFGSAGPAASGIPLVSNGLSADPSFKGIGGSLMAASYGVVCDGVTDNTSAFATLTTAIGTGGKRVIFPTGTCLTGSWSLAGLSNIIIEGNGGADITELVAGTYIVCTQTGATTCFDWSNSRSITVKNVTVGYNSSTFSGTLVSLSHTASTWTDCRFDNVQFKQVGATSHTAAALVYLKNTVQCVFSNVKFQHAQDGLVGDFNGGSPANTTNITCWGCTFIGLDSAAIRNPGPEWSVLGSWFFPKLNGTPVGIVSQAAYTVESLSILGTSFTDATLAGTWIDIGAIRGFTYHGGSIGGNSGVAVVGIKLGTVVGADISGIYGAFLGTGIQVTSTCDGLNVHGTDFSTTTTPKTGTTACTNSMFNANSPTSMNTLGVAAGKSFNSSNTVTLAAGADGNTYTFSAISGTIASLNTAQAWTNVQTFGDGNLVINGLTSGSTTVKAPATGGGTATFFPGTDTIACLTCSQALTGKTYNGLTVSTTTGTFTLTNGKTLSVSNSLTLAGTDSTTMTFPSTSQSIPGLGIANTFTASQAVTLSQAAQTSFTVTNSSTSTSAAAALVAVSNSGTFTASANNNPNTTGQAGFTWTGASGMLFAATHASGPLIFDSGGFNERMRILPSGAIAFGSSGTDLGASGRGYFDDYAVTAPKTVGTLATCNATSKGARSFVTDANAAFTAGIGAVVAAGGANNVPVTCDGTNWRIGANDNLPIYYRRKYA